MENEEGAMAVVHAENHDCVAWMSQKLVAQADTLLPQHHAASRPMVVEREAPHRATSLAEAPVRRSSLGMSRAAKPCNRLPGSRTGGLPVYGETCLHHLFLSAEDMELTGWLITTLSRSEMVWNDGVVLAEPGRGAFLPHTTPDPVLRHRQDNATNAA